MPADRALFAVPHVLIVPIGAESVGSQVVTPQKSRVTSPASSFPRHREIFWWENFGHGQEFPLPWGATLPFTSVAVPVARAFTSSVVSGFPADKRCEFRTARSLDFRKTCGALRDEHMRHTVWALRDICPTPEPAKRYRFNASIPAPELPWVSRLFTRQRDKPSGIGWTENDRVPDGLHFGFRAESTHNAPQSLGEYPTGA